MNLDLKLTLIHDGASWKIYNWRGQYCDIKPDFSNISDCVAILLRDVQRTIDTIADEILRGVPI